MTAKAEISLQSYLRYLETQSYLRFPLVDAEISTATALPESTLEAEMSLQVTVLLEMTEEAMISNSKVLLQVLAGLGICDQVKEDDGICVGYNAVDQRHHSPKGVAVRRYHHVNRFILLLSNNMAGGITNVEHFFNPIFQLEI